MTIDIPFELGELVYVIGKETEYEEEYIPESSYNVGVDWVRVPAHYDTHVIFRRVVKCVNFKFGLLDRYNLSEIFRNREDAEAFLEKSEE